jgi:putative MFS transporter
MFKAMAQVNVARGAFHRLFLNPRIFARYLCCILIGVPIWFVIGILMTFAPELAKEIGVTGTITGANAIMWSYLGLSAGDLAAGLISQVFKSRKKAVLIYLLATTALVLLYVFAPPMPPAMFYLMCVGLGVATGYWATFITVGAEQFGTNIRATVATTIPNFVRAAVVPMVFFLTLLRPTFGLMHAVLAIGVAVLAIAFVALYFLQETFGKSLDYHEQH